MGNALLSAPHIARVPNRAWMGLVALAAVVSRAVSLSSGLVFDDHITVTHPLYDGWSGALAGFVTNQSQSWGSNFYRPVLTLFEAALHGVIGNSPLGWHASSVALHVICCLLFFRLVLRLGGNPSLAAAAAVLFAVHPAHVESVGWISAIGEPFMACFLLLSALALLRWLQEGGAWYGASLAAAAAAVFSKETGVVMPVLVLAAGWALPAEKRTRRLTIAAAIPYFVISAVFLLARRGVLPAFSSPLNDATNEQMIATWPSALLFYLRHMAWPEAVVPFYPLRMAQGFSLAEFWLPLLGLLVVVAVAGFALWCMLGGRRAAFCAMWMMAPLAPALMLKVFADFELVHDRFLYVPLIGFCAGVVWIFGALAARVPDGRGPRLFSLLALALALSWGFLSLTESLWWQNDRALFTHAIAITPDNPRALVDLGDAYMRAGSLDAAVPYFQRALEYDPKSGNAHFGLGLVAYRQGNYAEAEQQIVQALRLKPRYDEWEYLARTALKLGKIETAERAALTALQISSRIPGAHEALGQVLLAKGDRAGAAAAFAAELRIDPQSKPARDGLAQVQEQ